MSIAILKSTVLAMAKILDLKVLLVYLDACVIMHSVEIL